MAQNYTIVDVRTPEEFESGNIESSINIPLDNVYDKIDYLKTLPQPIIFCCLSGGRSQQASDFARMKGVNCKNGGSWFILKNQISIIKHD